MIKPARRNHYPQIIRLEKTANAIFEEEFQTDVYLPSTWETRETFDLEIAEQDAVAIVSTLPENESDVKGFAIYKFDKKRKIVELLKIEGDDAAYYDIMKHLEQVCHKWNYKWIVMRSHEARIDQHKLLQAVGGKAIKTERKVFGEDSAYLFQWVLSIV